MSQLHVSQVTLISCPPIPRFLQTRAGVDFVNIFGICCQKAVHTRLSLE